MCNEAGLSDFSESGCLKGKYTALLNHSHFRAVDGLEQHGRIPITSKVRIICKDWPCFAVCVCQRGRGRVPGSMSNRSASKAQAYCTALGRHETTQFAELQIAGRGCGSFLAQESKWNAKRACVMVLTFLFLTLTTVVHHCSAPFLNYDSIVLHVKIICRCRFFHPHHDLHFDVIPCYTRHAVYASPAPASDHGQRRVQEGWNNLSHALA